MNAEEATRLIARQLPRELRRLRGRLMLDELDDSMGTRESSCPACSGTGWLNAGRMEDCPICLGFRDVPTNLADWFRDRFSAMLSERRPVSPRTRPSGVDFPKCRPASSERPFLRPLKCHVSLRD